MFIALASYIHLLQFTTTGVSNPFRYLNLRSSLSVQNGSLPSPLAFLLVSTNFTRTLDLPVSSFYTPSQLQTLYTQLFRLRLIPSVLPRLLAQTLPVLTLGHFIRLPPIVKYSLLLPLLKSGPSLNPSGAVHSFKSAMLLWLGSPLPNQLPTQLQLLFPHETPFSVAILPRSQLITFVIRSTCMYYIPK